MITLLLLLATSFIVLSIGLIFIILPLWVIYDDFISTYYEIDLNSARETLIPNIGSAVIWYIGGFFLYKFIIS
ncbi:hypothetical protein A6A10_08330 [Otariodibacter oris]|uniref:Uncharacterized protein n=1 Tax=Otariodibacter oris TaxID=1032623 RepID=A0A420XET9_9PAST|nr:hypothetical protein A6A10_08330 [Otariodibacter oris]RKR70777.1 hypothetical protein DES31_1776 [Otariodibacter oris]